ncbi:MAG: SOS response-associated peptidase [Planctomycetota bacterium]|nr:SOS response-associated peptidase [Planctomycetota bacterium]
MCGRFTLKTPNPRLQELFGLQELPHLVPRFNIAPTQSVFTIRASASVPELREAVMLRWGLIPFWAKDMAIGNTMINARAETVTEKPSFRPAFAKRRCLIPADGFFEWQKLTSGIKQPWWIRMADEEPFAMAGLWESWSPKKKAAGSDDDEISGSKLVQSCTILTINANTDMQSLHDRMPVILPIEAWAAWLNAASGKAELQGLLKPFANGRLIRSEVSTIVNRPIIDSPECIAPISEPSE